MNEETKTIKTNVPHLNVDEMQQAGLGFGHRVSRLHPKMKHYVTGIKNNVHMIDLEKSAKEFDRALKFIATLASQNKVILFVGTKVQMRELTKVAAQSARMPYVAERWLGGTFTNFETISKRVAHFLDLESKKAQGFFEKYTKKERLTIDKEIESLKNKFEGIRDMSKLPDAVLILDLKKDHTVFREAKRKGVTVIGIVDSNIDPTLVDYPIFANDDAISSVSYILDKIKETITNVK